MSGLILMTILFVGISVYAKHTFKMDLDLLEIICIYGTLLVVAIGLLIQLIKL